MPSEFKILTAPSAKFSALEIEYKSGSSITKSIPFKSAILVFSHLSIIDVEPTLSEVSAYNCNCMFTIGYFF